MQTREETLGGEKEIAGGIFGEELESQSKMDRKIENGKERGSSEVRIFREGEYFREGEIRR